MRKFIIAEISFHNNEMEMKQVVAANEFEALLQADIFSDLTPDWFTDYDRSIEGLKQLAFDSDGMVGVYEI